MYDGLVFHPISWEPKESFRSEDELTSGSTQNSNSEGAKKPNDVKLD